LERKWFYNWALHYFFSFHLFCNISWITNMKPYGYCKNVSYILYVCTLILSNLLQITIWLKVDFEFQNVHVVATPLWPSVGVKPNTWKSWRLGVLRDSRMFRARQQGAKHLALGCSWCHWKGLET
jgi:hypothetical protein